MFLAKVISEIIFGDFLNLCYYKFLYIDFQQCKINEAQAANNLENLF